MTRLVSSVNVDDKNMSILRELGTISHYVYDK